MSCTPHVPLWWIQKNERTRRCTHMLHAHQDTQTQDVRREAVCEDKGRVLETGAQDDSGLVYHGSSLKIVSQIVLL